MCSYTVELHEYRHCEAAAISYYSNGRPVPHVIDRLSFSHGRNLVNLTLVSFLSYTLTLVVVLPLDISSIPHHQFSRLGFHTIQFANK